MYQALDCKAAEEAVENETGAFESSDWFLELIHTSSNPIVLSAIDSDRIVEINEAAAKLFRCRRSDSLSRTFMDLFQWQTPDQTEAFAQCMERAGSFRNMEARVALESGEIRDFLYSVKPIVVGGEACLLHMLADVFAPKSEMEALQHSEQKYRMLVENSLQGLAIVQDERFVSCNEAFAQMTGYSVAELLALSKEEMEAMIHPDDRDVVRYRVQNRMSGKYAKPRYQYRGLRRNGDEFQAEVLASRVDYNGKPAIQIAYVEVTERRKAEAAASEASERLNLALEAAGMTCWDLDIPTGAAKDDDAWLKNLGYAADEIPQDLQHRNELIHPEDFPLLKAAAEDHLKGKTPIYEIEYRVRNKAGFYSWVLDRGKVITRDSAGNPLRTVGVHFDITKQKLASEKIRQLSNEQRAVLNTLSLGILYLKDRKVQWTNPALLQMFGYESDELLGRGTLRLYADPQDYQRIASEGYAAIVSGEVYSLEIPMIRKDGSQFWCTLAGQSINAGNIAEGSIWVFQDVTERRQSDAVLRKNEARFRKLLQNSSDMIVVLNDHRRIIHISDAVQKHLGYRPDELFGLDGFSNIHPDDLDNAAKMISGLLRISGETRRFESRIKHKNGTWVPIEMVGANLLHDPDVNGIVLNVRDISERNRLQEQLQQAMKMEAVGVLAGGVAHDFNNLLSVIKGYSELLLEDLDPDDPMHADLEQIAKAGQRAAALTSQLLAFSRKQILQPAILDLNAVVTDMSTMLQRMIGEDIDLATVAAAGLGAINADPGQIQQIIMNLAVNARDAMPQGGKLTIETANVELGDAYSREHPAVSPGPYVMIAVSDTGTGMSQETRARIFEPFFTTKEKGRGTGLGLSTVYGIVKQSNGFIWVYSEVDKGTTFKIYFPRAIGEIPSSARPVKAVQELQGSETILIAEDEDSVRALASRILRQQGYAVLAASSGMEALRIAREFSGNIDLVLTDVVMPGMSGRTLVTHLEESLPGIKSLYVSGYTETAIVHHGALDPNVAFLQKPFATEGLLRKVREVLDS